MISLYSRVKPYYERQTDLKSLLKEMCGIIYDGGTSSLIQFLFADACRLITTSGPCQI